MPYNPEDKIDSEKKPTKIEEGEYPFSIHSAEEKTYKRSDGTDGEMLKLILRVGEGRGFDVYDTIFFTGKALWKMEQLMWSLGLDFKVPYKDPKQLKGYSGTAYFIKGEEKENGNRYLEIRNYIYDEELEKKPIAPLKADVSDIPF